MTAAALAALAGQATAQQQQVSPSEARQLSQKLQESDKSLTDAIELAERETGGKALAAKIMGDSDVQRAYSRKEGGQMDRPQPGEGREPGQRPGERPGEDPQRDLDRERQRENPDRQRENRERLTSGQQRGLHASVICVVDDTKLHEVVVNLEESRVVDARPMGASGDRQQSGDISTGGSDQMRMASDIINVNVVDAQGEDIGDIDDLALDVTSGQVRYAVFRTGGFLGMGGDRHAVPLNALSFTGDDEVRLNVTEEQMEQREGFDDDRWPQQPSPAWGSQPGQQDRQQPGQQQRPGQERQPDVQRPGQQGQQQMSSTVEKASDVIGATLHGPGDASVGDVDDIVIKPSDSSIGHYIIATDDGKVAVPASEIQMRNRQLTLSMEQTEFDRLPRFRDNENPDWTNQEWLRDNEGREGDAQRRERNPGDRGGG